MIYFTGYLLNNVKNEMTQLHKVMFYLPICRVYMYVCLIAGCFSFYDFGVSVDFGFQSFKG